MKLCINLKHLYFTIGTCLQVINEKEKKKTSRDGSYYED